MVYCGKPSKACAECRLRRTKCDTKRPSCSQCVRAGRICKGYRDPADLMFRDESHGLSTRRKRVKDAEARKTISLTSTLERFDDAPLVMTECPQSIELPTFPLFPTYLGTSPEDQATCFFFQNYVLEKDSFARGNFQYLSDIYGDEEIGPALAAGVASLGFVGLSNFWRAPCIMTNATIKYNTAMRDLSSKLRNIEDAKADQTLVTIMLLVLYETNTCNSRLSMDTWMKHINGALALLQLRGKEQLQTPIGYHVFTHLRTQVIICCSQRHAKFPEIITEWSSELDFETPEQASATILSNLAIRYCNLRAGMESFNDYTDPETLVTELIKLDEEYEVWAKTCPIHFMYDTVNLSTPFEDVFSDQYHEYPSIWIGTIWNNYRCVRLLINELIFDQLTHLYENNPASSLFTSDSCFFQNQFLGARTKLLHLCHDICASVPYFLGFNPDAQNGLLPPIPKAVHGNLLLWPLYSAGCTNMVSPIMRRWVENRLRWIADEFGVRQAEPLAIAMSRRQDISQWDMGEGLDKLAPHSEPGLLETGSETSAEVDKTFEGVAMTFMNENTNFNDW